MEGPAGLSRVRSDPADAVSACVVAGLIRPVKARMGMAKAGLVSGVLCERRH